MTRGAKWTLLAFAASLLGVLFGIGHISSTTLELIEREAEARRQAALEENVRLALWRFDSTLTALIAREGAHPYFIYSALVPSGRLYDRMFGALADDEPARPSPLLTENDEEVRLHFLIDPSGRVSSPEVPEGAAEVRVPAGLVEPERAAERAARLSALRSLLGPVDLARRIPEGGANVLGATAGVGDDPLELADSGTPQNADLSLEVPPKAVAKKNADSRSKSSMEWLVRSRSVQQAASYNATPVPRPSRRASTIGRSTNVRLGVLEEGPVTPLWVTACPEAADSPCDRTAEPALVLARRIRQGDETYVVGAWLDWAKIRRDLLASAEDLLPNAALLPVPATPGSELAATPDARDRRLASLPVRLVPGPLPWVEVPDDSPVRLTLGVAWLGVLLAAAAVAALLFGTLALSERRAVFVSAVTHELRTPLTTFRMYSEMLADGMVSDPAKTKLYLETLRREAVRLGHLVENVLAFARIERGRHAGPLEALDAREVLERMAERLRDRALSAGMTLDLATPSGGVVPRVRADATALEQILFNLVDNACKYAASSEDKRIELALGTRDHRVDFSVRDFGPGLARDAKRRLFVPFSKSAEVAAVSAPGVGLGLALSRRLARSMGGDLRLEPSARGAHFVLSLPAA